MKNKVFFMFLIFLIVFSVQQKVLANEMYNSCMYYPETPVDLNSRGEKVGDTNYLERIKATDLHEQGYTGKNIKVAVFDSGISNSEDLIVKHHENYVLEETTEDFNCHGTHIAGIIAAQHNNKGIDGVAPGVDLYSVKITNKNADVSGFEYIAQAFDWAVQNDIDIINFSNGWDGMSWQNWLVKYPTGLNKSIKSAHNAGIIIVVSAGNESVITDEEDENYGEEKDIKEDTVSPPGNYEGVLTISNVDNLDVRNPYSSHGPSVDFAAPGVNILSTINDNFKPENPYGYHSGTSMSAPVVVGILALLKEKYPDASNDELMQYLIRMAEPKKGYSTAQSEGFGIPTYTYSKNDEYGYGVIRGEIGDKANELIKLEENIYESYDLPIKGSVTGLGPNYYSVKKGTYEVVRKFEDWFEIKISDSSLDKGEMHRWIIPSKFSLNSFKMTLHDKTTYLYDGNNTGKTNYTLHAQTVNVLQHTGEWFKISTWLGEKWIKPNKYSIGDFNITTNIGENIFDNKDDTNKISYLGPQTLKVLSRNGDWFKINTWLGEKWIKPTDYFIGDFNVTMPLSVPIYLEKNGKFEYYRSAGAGTVKISNRKGEFFQLPDSNEWIKPEEFYLNSFKIVIKERTDIWDKPYAKSGKIISSLSPQTVTATYLDYSRNSSSNFHYNWFLINSWLGPVYLFLPLYDSYQLIEIPDAPI